MMKRVRLKHKFLLALYALALVVALADSSLASSGGHGASPILMDRGIGPPSESGVRGVKLGDFRIRIYYPAEARKSSISFKAYARIQEEHLPEFRKLFVHRRHKIRDQVIIATRRVPLVDFDDADLKAFRRRILLRLRRMMPELVIDDIYMSEFQIDVDNL